MKKSTKKLLSVMLAILTLSQVFTIGLQVTAANTFLGNLYVETSRPTVGATPDNAFVDYNHRNEITLDTYWWRDDTTGATMTSSSTFEEGKTYRIYVKIKTQTGYQFDKNTVVYLAGKKAELTYRDAYNITATVTWKLETFTMDIYSFSIPKIGNKLADTPVGYKYDTDLTVTDATASWGSNSMYKDAFTSGQSYYATFAFTFEEELADEKHISVTVNETSGNNIVVYTGADEHTVFIVYEFTYRYIDVIDFLIPDAGDKAAIYKNTYDYESNLGIKTADLKWFYGNSEVTTFEAGKTYRAEIIFTTDYSFDTKNSNLVKVTVNGKDDNVNIMAIENFVAVSYDVTIGSGADLGDVNQDGEVDNLDALVVLKYDAGVINDIADNADVNKDGEIDNLDALAILKYDAGILDSLS